VKFNARRANAVHWPRHGDTRERCGSTKGKCYLVDVHKSSGVSTGIIVTGHSARRANARVEFNVRRANTVHGPKHWDTDNGAVARRANATWWTSTNPRAEALGSPISGHCCTKGKCVVEFNVRRANTVHWPKHWDNRHRYRSPSDFGKLQLFLFVLSMNKQGHPKANKSNKFRLR
jgi:hypothetical protein